LQGSRSHLFLLFQFLYLAGKSRQFCPSGQHAAGTHGRTAGERTAGIDDLPVQRDDTEPVLISFRQSRRRVQIFRHDDSPQQELYHAGKPFLIPHQIARQIHKALVLFQTGFVQCLSPHGSQRQECGTSGVLLLQKADPLLGSVFVFHDQILHGTAQCGFQCHAVFLVGGNQLCHRAEYAAGPAAICPQDCLDAAAKALHVSFHIL